VQLNNKASP